MPRVVVPAPYRGPTAGRERIDVEGATVRQCLQEVGDRHPGFSELVFDADGRLHRFVTLFVNGEEIGRDTLDAAVGDADEVEVLSAIAGG
jgi:molybdopterin converting factor small subunit